MDIVVPYQGQKTGQSAFIPPVPTWSHRYYTPHTELMPRFPRDHPRIIRYSDARSTLPIYTPSPQNADGGESIGR